MIHNELSSTITFVEWLVVNAYKTKAKAHILTSLLILLILDTNVTGRVPDESRQVYSMEDVLEALKDVDPNEELEAYGENSLFVLFDAVGKHFCIIFSKQMILRLIRKHIVLDT